MSTIVAKDLLYPTARGTASTYEILEKVMKQAPDLSRKLDKTKARWCRRFSNTLRRDCTSTASEGVNGGVKRIALDNSQIGLAKAFLSHGIRTHQECCEEATKFRNDELMPLARHYYSVDLDASKSFTG